MSRPGMTTLVEVLLRNPRDHSDTLTYYIEPLDNPLALAWVKALKDDLINLPDFTIERSEEHTSELQSH